MSTIQSGSITERLLRKLPPAAVPHEYGEAYASTDPAPSPGAPPASVPASSITARLLGKLPNIQRPSPGVYEPGPLQKFAQAGIVAGIEQVPSMASGLGRFIQSGMAFKQNPQIGVAVAAGQAADTLTELERMRHPAMPQPSAMVRDAIASAPRLVPSPVDRLVSRVAGGVADNTGRVADAVGSFMPPDANDIGSAAWAGKIVGGVAPQLGAQAAVGLATGGATVPSMVPMFLMEAGDSTQQFYGALKENGYSDEDALAGAFLPAVGASIAKSAIEQVGGKEQVIRDVAKQMARGVVKDAREIAKTAVKSAGAGAAEELSQGEIDRMTSAVLSGRYSDLVNPQTMQQRFEEAVGGAIGESVAAGGFRAVQAIPETAGRAKDGSAGAAGRQSQKPSGHQNPQAPAGSPENPVIAKAIKEVEDRLRARHAGKTDEEIVAAMGEDEKAAVRDEIVAAARAASEAPQSERDALMEQLGLKQPAKQPTTQTPPTAPRRGGNTLGEILASDRDPPEVRYARGEITRDEMVAELEAAFANNPSERARREFEEMGKRDEERRRGDSNEGGVVAGGLRGPGPVEGAGGGGVAVPVDVRAVGGGVAPVVGGEGQQAGDQPGDVGGGRSASEVSNWYGMSQDEERADLARRIAEHERTGKTREEAFASAQDDLNAGADSLLSQDGAILEDEYGDRYQVQHTAAERGGPKNQRALVKLTEDGNPIGDPNSQPWISPDDARRTARSLRRVNPQQPGAVTAATQREGASHGQGQEEGQQEGLLNTTPAATDKGATGDSLSPPTTVGTATAAPSDSVNLDAMTHDQLREYAKSVGVPPRGSPDGIRARIRKAEADRAALSAKGNPAISDSSTVTASTPEYAALPAKTREAFEVAYAARDVEKLAEYLDPRNKVLRAEFAARAGLERMPPGITRTRAAVEAWAASSQSPSATSGASAPSRSAEPSPQPTTSRAPESAASPAASSTPGSSVAPVAGGTKTGVETASPQSTPEPWEMTREEYRDADPRLVAARKARNDAYSAMGGRWGEARRFAGRADGNKIAKADAAQVRASKAFDAAGDAHRKYVDVALSAGKPVPARVLAEYPDLAEKYGKKPEAAEPPKSNIQMAREKAQARREAKVLDTQVNTREYGVVTRRDLVDRELADGYTPETVEVTDTAAVTKAEGTKALMDKRGDVPFGNPNHPETIRYRELQKTLMIPPKVPEYRMNKGDRYRVLTKIEYDYAAGKAKESAPAQPESKPNPYADDIAKLTPLLDKVLNSKDIPRKQAIDVGIVLNGEAPKVQEALAARLWEKSPEVAEYVVKDGPIGVRSVVQKARPAIETRAGLGLRQNSAGKWAWFDGDSQKTGAYATADEARKSPEIEAIESNRKRSEEPASPTSIKSHPEYARLHRMYGASSREQIQTKIDQMTAEIADHAKVAQREFTGQGTRRTGAAVSAQAVRDIGNEKLLLTAYMNERFPAKPATPGVAQIDASTVKAGDEVLLERQDTMAGEPTEYAPARVEGVKVMFGEPHVKFVRGEKWRKASELRMFRRDAEAPATPKVASATPDVAPKEAPKPSGFLSNLSAADQARAEELRQKLAKKLAQQRSTLSMNAGGFDPEMLSLGAEYASLHIKAGAKRFAVFAREMVTNLGDGIKPYLRALYSAARQMPGVDKAGTDSGDYVDSLTDADIDAMVGGKTEETPTTDATVTGAQDEAAVSATPERTLDAIASEFRDRMRQEWTTENLEAIGALRREANARFGIENLENVPTAQQPPRPAAVIQKDIDALQKRIDNLHANYKGPGRGGTRAQTTTYNANVGRLAESMGALKDELKRAQAAEPTATDKSAKSIMSEMLAEQSRWYQAKESSTHQQVQEWLRGGDAPPRIFGDSNGRPIRANISESALERRALGVRSTRKTAVAVVQDAKSRMWFIVSLPVTSLDPYTFVADSPFAHSDDYEVWRRYPYVGSTTIMDALASQYLRAWSKENPNESPPPESAVLATGPRADDPKATEESQASSTTPARRYYNGDKGSMKSLGLQPAAQIRVLAPNKRSGWHYVETPDGAALVDPFDDYGVRFVAENEKSGGDLLRARTEAKAYADDHPVEKKPWQMTKAEFERDHPQGKMRHFESPSSEDKAKEIEAAIAKAGVRARISERQDPRLGATTSIVPILTGGPNPSMKLTDEESARLQTALREAGISFRIDPDTGTITNVKISREFDLHERQVRRAHAEGLPVPDAVLAEYGLANKAGDLVVKPIGGEEPKQPSAPLQRAREARANKVLDEQMMARSRGKVMTRRELVDAEIAEGATPLVQDVEDTAAVNRAVEQKKIMDRRIVPTGNPNHPETIRYRELEATIKNPPKKPEYRMVKDGAWRVLTKSEYDYAVTKKRDAGEQAAKKDNDPYAADIEKLTAILRKQVATESSPRRQGQAAIVVLNGEAPAVQEAVAKVLWEIAPGAAEYVASDGPIGVRGVVAKAKPEVAASPTSSEQPITIVGDAERIEFEGGGSMLRYSLSDGSFLDEAEGRVTHWRPVGPGRQTWGIFEASAEDALADINGIRTVRVQKSSETAQTTTPPAKPDEIGKYRVFERPGEGWAVNWTDQSGATQGRRGLKTREEAESLAREWDARDKENEADRRSRHPMTLAEYPKVRDRIMSGQQTAEEHKDLARWLVRSEEAIKAELDSRTLKQLAPNGVRSGTTKAEVVNTIYRNMLSRFHLGDSVSYNPFAKETYESALLKQIEATTDADIAAFVEKRQKAIDARTKALENPETLEEFRQFIAKNGESALSIEQRKKYDALTADVNKRIRGDDRPDYIAKVDTGNVAMTIKEGFHSKANIPLWIVQLSGRVPSETYTALNAAAKKLGGWWSSFKKDSTGFQFKTKEAAEEFVKVNQQGITTANTDAIREEDSAQKAAERLAEMAEAQEDAANESLGRDRNTNTVRRARMAEGAEADARKAKQLAQTLANIAEGIKDGSVKALRGLRNMTQLTALEQVLTIARREYWYGLPEESRRELARNGQNEWWNLPIDENIIAKATMPKVELNRSNVQILAQKGLTTPGIKREAAKIDKLWRYEAKRKPDGWGVTIDNPYDFSAMKALTTRLKQAGQVKYEAERIHESLMHHQRIADMGLRSDAEVRVVLREYMGLRAGQVKPDRIREMERGLIGKTVGIDFFPTPPALANEIVEKADIEPGMKVLEPSAGNGRIADAIKAAGVEPDVAEVSGDLREILAAKGHALAGRDFMEFNPGPVYDRIVMNPPFSDRQDVEHVRHAYDLLKPGGRIVAIMSEGPFFGQDKKASEFRDWLDTVGTSEQLPEGSFESDKSGLPTTGVNARVVVIDKPQAGEKFSVSYGSQKVGEFTVSGATPKVGDTLLTKDSGVTHGRWLVEKVGEPKGGNTTIDLREIGNRRNSQQIAWPDQSGEFWSESGSPADPLHDKVMDFRQRLNDATKRSDLTGMEDEARMLADAADRANRSDLITMARGFVGQVQEKSGRLAAQEYRAKQDLMGEKPVDKSAPTPEADRERLVTAMQEQMRLEKAARSEFYKTRYNDIDDATRRGHEDKEASLRDEADGMVPEIASIVTRSVGEYPSRLPDVKPTQPAAGTPEAKKVLSDAREAERGMEELWAQERELDREIGSKASGSKIRATLERKRESLRETVRTASAEWTKRRDAMIRMKQEHAYAGADPWRRLAVMATWNGGEYTSVANYLVKVADHIAGQIAPVLDEEARGMVARAAVSRFMETPLSESLTSRLDSELYVHTKKANQAAAIKRVNEASPLQTSERSKFIRDIENTDDKDAMGKIAAEAEAMAAERNAQEAEVERIQAEAEAKEKESNTAALTDPSKMRATTARQAMGKRALPAGSPVNGTNKLAVWTENIPAKLRSQIESLGEEPITVRGNALTSEAMARMAGSLADKSADLATIVGAVGRDGEPFVMFAYGKDGVGAVNGKLWAYANTLGQGEWFTDGSGDHLVLKSDGKPIVMVAGIRKEAVPTVNLEGAKARASRGWKDASEPSPKTYLTPKSTAPTETIDQSAYPSLEDLGIKTEYSALVAKAEQATRDYHAALDAVSDARNRANTSLTDEVILAKARAMSGDDEPSSGFRSIAVDALIRENPDLKAATAAVEVAQKAKILAERAVESERHRAASAFKGEAKDKYREMVKGRKWWQHDAEANAIERLWSSDPRVSVLRELANTAANSYEIDTRGEVLPPDFKPGVGVGNVSESSVNYTTDKPSAMGVSTADIGARAKKRGKADWTIELTTWPGDSSDPNGAWLAGDRLKPVEAMVKLAKLAPEFGSDPVLTAKGDKLVWNAGTESFAFVNPWYKSAEEPGPIAQGQSVRIDVEALKNLRGKVWARPVADTVAVADSAPAKKALTLLEKLDRIAADAKDRIKQRGIKNRGRTSGATTLIDDTLDLAVVVAAEAAKAGVVGGRKLTALVSKVVTDLRSNGTIKDGRGVDEAAIRRVAKGLIRDGGQDEAKLLASYADARDAVERSRTRRVGKAIGNAKGVKKAVADAVREGRPEVSKPAESRAKTYLEEVQRGPLREESARKAGEDAGFVEGLGVGKQLGEHKTRTAAAREIMRARREGHRAGVNQASAAIPSLIRQARNAFKRGQQVGKVEARSQVEEQATKAAAVDGLRKQVVQLAESLPPSLRGRYLRAAANVKTPSNVVAVLNRMRRDVSKYNGRQFMRGVERLAVRIPKLTEDRRYEARKALTAARAAFTIIKQSGASADDLLRASTDIQAAYAEMAKHATEQRNEDKVRLVRRAVSAAEVRDEMIGALGKKKPLPAGDTPGARDPGRVVLWLRKYANVRTMAYMLDSDYHGKGPFSRLYKAMARGRRLALGMQHGFQDAMEGLVRKRGYKDLGEFLARVSGTLGSASQETTDVSIGDVARNPNGAKRLTLGQAMYVYALDAATRAKAHAGQMFTFGDDPDGPKFRLTDDDFNRVEAALTADQKALVDEIKKEYDRTFFDRLSEVNKRLNGVYLDKVAGYWGIKRAMKQSDNPDVGKGWEQLVVRALHNAAMLQERTGGSAPIVIGDFGVDVLRRSESAATIVHKADLVRAIGKTALSPAIREEINARWGKTAMERLERVVIEYAGNQLPAIDQGIRGLMSNVARAKTQLNPTTWLRNISSVFMLQAVMPYSTIAKGMSGLMNQAAYRELMQYSPELRERWSGAGGQIAYMVPGATSHGSTGAIDASKATIRQVASAAKALAGMKGLEFRRRMQDVSKPWKEMLDALTLGNVFDAAAATVAYKGYLAEAPATMSPEDQKRWAARRATEAFQQTANTNDLLNSTGLQEDARSSTITAGLLAFTSDIAKKQNVLWIANKRGAQARIRATMGIGMSVAWSVLVAWAFAALLGGDEDDRDKAAKDRLFDEAMSLLPGGTIVRRVTDRYGSSGVLDSPLTGVIMQLAIGMNKVYGGVSNDDSDRLRDGLFRLFQSGSDLTGAPFGLWAGMIRRAFRGWSE